MRPSPTIVVPGLLCFLALHLVMVAGIASADGSGEDWPVLRPEPVELGLEPVRGPQYLGADAKGRLVLIRGARPVLHEIRSGGKVRPWGDPESRQAIIDGGAPGLFDASRGLDGRWLVLQPDRLLLIGRSDVEILPMPSWEPLSVALLDHPVAAVIPVIRDGSRKRRRSPVPPILLEHSSSGWTRLADDPFSEAEKASDKGGSGYHSHRAHRALALAPADGGGLWAANRYLYRLRRFSDSGQEVLDLTLEPEAVPSHLDDEAVAKLTEKLTEKANLLGEEGASIRPFTVKAALRAVAEGRDGKVYLYVAPGVVGNQPILDRYDPTNHRLERAALAIDDPGRVTLAAGKDGLWIASVGSNRAFWRIPWLSLQDLPWKAVPGLHLDGLPVAP